MESGEASWTGRGNRYAAEFGCDRAIFPCILATGDLAISRMSAISRKGNS